MFKSIPKTLLLAMCAAAPVVSYGASRSPEEAKNVATDFFRNENISRLADKDALTLVHVVDNGSLSPVSYVFNAKDGKGFIIISANDDAIPVIGYSDTNIWNVDAAPATVTSLLSVPVYDDGAAYSVAVTRATPGATKVLSTPEWSQEAPFNNRIPNRRLTGCVGVAVAEIMKYHNSPAQRPSTLIKDGEESAYAWETMLTGNYRSGYTSEQGDAVAALVADAAIAIGTDFGMSSSSAFEVKVPYALTSMFGYDAGVSYKKLSEISQNEWVEILINEVDEDRPVLFSGQDVSAGHAFVCDGYRTDASGSTMLHFNWGWGGSANGYFAPGALNPTVSRAHSYNSLQTIVYNIKPAQNNLKWSPIHLTNDENQVGLTIDVSDISAVASFTLRAGTLKNISNTDFSGQLAVALFDSEGRQKALLNNGRNFSLIALQVSKYVDFTGQLPEGISVAADDVVRLVTKADGQSEWLPVAGDLLVMGEARAKNGTLPYFNITLPSSSADYEVTVADSRVIKGRDYTFKVVGTNPEKVVTVKSNGFILSPDANNNYKVTNVLADQQIDIIVQNVADVVSKRVLWLEAGNLQNLLNEYETSSIVDLTLFGSMNAIDFNFIRERMKLNRLDISQVTIVANGANPANAIPAKALQGYRSLNTLLLPRNLATLKNGCLAQTGLTSIEIPAGVTTIEYNIFVACNQLREVIYRRSNPAWINWCVFNGTPKEKLVVPPGATNTFKNKEYWQDFKEIVEEAAPAVESYNVSIAETKALSYTLLTEGTMVAPNTTYRFKVDTDDSIGDAIMEVYANSTRLYPADNGEYSHKITNNTLFHVEFRQPEATTVDNTWKLSGAAGGIGLASEIVNVPFNKTFIVRANAMKIPAGADAAKFYAMVLTDKNGGIKEFISPVYTNTQSTTGNQAFNFSCQVKEASIKEGNYIRLATSYNKRNWALVPGESEGITDRLSAIGNSVVYHTVSMPSSVPGARVEGGATQVVRGMPFNLKVTAISPIQRATVTVNGETKATNLSVANVNIPAVTEDLEIAIMIKDANAGDFVALHVQEGNLESKLKEYGETPARLKLIGSMYISDFNALRDRAAAIMDLDLSDITIKGDAATMNSIPENAFASNSTSVKTALTTIILPRNLTKISDNAFARCTVLKEISIPASVVYVGQGAFGNCEALKKIVFEGSEPPLTASLSPLPANTSAITCEVPAGAESNYESAGWWSQISPKSAKQYYWVKYDDQRTFIYTNRIGDVNKIEVPANVTNYNVPQVTLGLPNCQMKSKKETEAIRRPGVAFKIFDNGIDLLEKEKKNVESAFKLDDYGDKGGTVYGGQYVVKCDPRVTPGSYAYAQNHDVQVVFFYPIEFSYLEGAEGVKADLVELNDSDKWNTNWKWFDLYSTKTSNTVYREAKDYKFRLTPPSDHITLAVTVENKVMVKPGYEPVYEYNSFEVLPDNKGIYTIPNLQGDTEVKITGHISVAEGEPIVADDLTAVSKTEVAEYKELTITGEVTEEQFQAVREKFESVETLDLSGIQNDVLPAAALSGLENLKNVMLPENIQEVGDGAFKDCPNLESVTIPGVTSIGTGAFQNCTHLESVTIPNATSIGEGAFYGCENLTSIQLPAAGSASQTRAGGNDGITAESFKGLNPNCLIYLNDTSIPNSEHLNIILNKNNTRVADSDIIIDTRYPFNAPGSFNLGEYKISFTAHIPGSNNADVDGGWAGFILPFDPTGWEYGVQIDEREGIQSGLVLKTLDKDDNLIDITFEDIEANRPYLAHVVAPYESVPVTFYAVSRNDSENFDLMFTPPHESLSHEGKNFILYGSLDGETMIGSTWAINEQGSKFEFVDTTKVVPFGAYLVPVGNPGVSEVMIGEHDFWVANPTGGGVSGAYLYRGDKVELASGTNGAAIYYTLDGTDPTQADGTRELYDAPLTLRTDDNGIMNIRAVAIYKGNVSDKVSLEFQLKRVNLNYALAQNWNWISHNMENEVAVSEFMGEGVTRVLSQTQEKFRDPKYGLIGNLESIEPAKGYKVCAAEATTANISGVAFNPTATVKLRKGWNWIGCPVDDASLKISDLFANLEAEEGDMIIGLDGFTQFDSFGEWTGIIESLENNAGYLLYSNSAKEFTYNMVQNPGELAGEASVAKEAPTRTLEDTPWVVDIHRYPSVMPITASLTNADGLDADPADYRVAAFCGNECRGIGVNINGLVMLNIHGNTGDNIVIRYIDSYDNEYITSTSITFNEMPVGTIAEPFNITLDIVSSVDSIAADGLEIVSENGSIVVKGELGEGAVAEIYDLAGNRLATSEAINGTVTIDGLESGVRLIVIRTASTTLYRKVMVK